MWTRPADIKAKVRKWWDSGELLSEVASEVQSFPRTINLVRPKSTELAEKFVDVRKWVGELNTLEGCEIITKIINHRVIGKNKIPVAVKFESLEDAARFIDKRAQLKCFKRLLAKVRERKPAIVPWLQKNPLAALSLESDWDRIIDIVTWFEQNPTPNMYLRQVDVPNVHTKMIEEYKSTIWALLQLCLTDDTYGSKKSNRLFESRFGFLVKPLRIRFRILDPKRCIFKSQDHIPDITLDALSFSLLDPEIKFVFIVENETNFLAFPQIEDALVIFGQGYGFESLSRVAWLFKQRVFYWGDIDTHGFNILNSAKKCLPHLRSMLMDETTLLSHREHWVTEDAPIGAVVLDNLSDSEHDFYDKLRTGRYGVNVRLEQEKLSWSLVKEAIEEALATGSQTENSLGDFSRRKAITEISDHNIDDLMQPSECALRAYLNIQEPSLRSKSEYLDLFTERLKKIKYDELSRFCNPVVLLDGDSNERAAASCESLNRHLPVLFKPLLTVSALIDGCKCQISGEPDFLIAEGSSYVVRNFTLFRNLKEDVEHARVIQIQLHGWLLEQITGIAPLRLELKNDIESIFEIAYDSGCEALRKLTEINSIAALSAEPYSPVGWTKCSSCDYQTRCWSKAREAGDVSMLVGVDQSLSKTLRRLGIATVQALSNNVGINELANLQRKVGDKRIRLGTATATNILDAANAMLTQSFIIKSKPTLPNLDTYAIIDFEGMSSFENNPDSIFLWGMQLFGHHGTDYSGAFSSESTAEQDCSAWQQFLNNWSNIFESVGDIPIFHWNHYERTKLDQYAERFEDSTFIADRVKTNMIDLLEVVRSYVVLPLPSYGLKVVEKFVGFQRTQKNVGGDWVMATYQTYLQSNSGFEKQQLLSEIYSYNQEDVLSTNAILLWFLEHCL